MKNDDDDDDNDDVSGGTNIESEVRGTLCWDLC
jgi:hypothetical protein